METQIDVVPGEPVLLAGLLEEKIQEQLRGIPGLREIPILGKLFGSREFLEQKSELVVVLQPSVHLPHQPLRRIRADFPAGPVPPPRDWMAPTQEQRVRADANFPWNVLQ
jgi:pilus assembly protein CpaC